MKKRNSVLSMLLAGAMVVALTACGGNAGESKTESSSDATATESTESSSSTSSAMSSLEALQKKGTLTVGMMAATPPYEFHKVVDGEDEIIGCDIALIEEVAKDLGVDYEIKDMDFDGLLMAMQAGKIDMIVSAMSPTEERSKNADFSEVYYKDSHQVVIHKDDADEIQTAEDLKGATIAVIKSSVQEQIVLNQIEDATPKSLGKSTDLALDLSSKKVDAMLVDIPTAKLLTNSNDNLMLTDIYYDDDTLGAAIAMPKGTGQDIMDTVNATVERVKPGFGDWVTEYMEQVDTEK